MDVCGVPDCGRPVKHRREGLCSGHAERLRLTGDVRASIPLRAFAADQGCSVQGCARPYHGRGLCAVHLARQSRTGTTDAARLRLRGATLAERLEQYTVTDSGCWEWQRNRIHSGYGMVWNGTKIVLAHRASYEVNAGPIPEGMYVLHSCDNPPCINPAHLRLGSQAENMADRRARTGYGRRTT